MRIKIHCKQCKDESLLKTQAILTLEQAKETVRNITEVIRRHEMHPNQLDFYITEDNKDEELTHYVYDALKNRMKKHEYIKRTK